MREVLTGLAERRLTDVAEARLAEEPVLVLNGPRTVGKSTLLNQLAGRLGRPVIECDDPATRSAVRADPGRFVESAEPGRQLPGPAGYWPGPRAAGLHRTHRTATGCGGSRSCSTATPPGSNRERCWSGSLSKRP